MLSRALSLEVEVEEKKARRRLSGLELGEKLLPRRRRLEEKKKKKENEAKKKEKEKWGKYAQKC